MARKSTDEQMKELRERQKQLQAQLAALEARKKADARKRETRRKIVAGGAVISHAEIDPAFREMLREVLQKAVTRDIDKAVIGDLLAGPAPSASA